VPSRMSAKMPTGVMARSLMPPDWQKRRDERVLKVEDENGVCGDCIGPAGWWVRVAPPFYPPSFGHGHPKRGGKRTLFSEEMR
jgi:hypothetical protein